MGDGRPGLSSPPPPPRPPPIPFSMPRIVWICRSCQAEEKNHVSSSINGELLLSLPQPDLPPQVGPASFLVQVLELMREAQIQHGLRHGNYMRYRFSPGGIHTYRSIRVYLVFPHVMSNMEILYRTLGLRRLCKSLKFLHGRGKFPRWNVTESTETDARNFVF